MRITADGIIKAGFWVQVMLLVLVDAGSLAAFLRAPTPWYHWAGLVVVNAALVPLAVVVWRWLRTQHSALPPVGPPGPEA